MRLRGGSAVATALTIFARASTIVKPQLKEMPGSKSGKFQLASGHVPVDLLGEQLLVLLTRHWTE
jgi:hypothetical protein